MKQVIFYISDGTGITAETLGHSLISQFDGLQITSTTIPYLNTTDKAHDAVKKINAAALKSETPPLLMATIIDDEIREIIAQSNGNLFEFFNVFLQPLSKILKMPYSHIAGRSHGIPDQQNYKSRIDAVNLALSCDDGLGVKYYNDADLILLGPSRSGKTPTCLYLALQFGVGAANYPLVTEDLNKVDTPEFFEKYHDKIFGLIPDPNRLHSIRQERILDSKYSSKTQCIWEINKIEKIYKRNNIPYLNATNLSIEEIATKVLEMLKIIRKII